MGWAAAGRPKKMFFFLFTRAEELEPNRARVEENQNNPASLGVRFEPGERRCRFWRLSSGSMAMQSLGVQLGNPSCRRKLWFQRQRSENDWGSKNPSMFIGFLKKKPIVFDNGEVPIITAGVIAQQ
ncbi:hypothetical protein ACFX2F_040482 [Malus domestica]